MAEPVQQFQQCRSALAEFLCRLAHTDQPPWAIRFRGAVDANNAAQTQYQQQLAAYNQQKASTPGTTLNSTPSQGFQQGVPNTLNPSGNAMVGQLEWGGLPGTTNHQTAGAYLQGLQSPIPFSGAQQPQQQSRPKRTNTAQQLAVDDHGGAGQPWQGDDAWRDRARHCKHSTRIRGHCSRSCKTGGRRNPGTGSGFQQTFRQSTQSDVRRKWGRRGWCRHAAGSGGQPNSGNNMLGNQLSGNMIGSTPRQEPPRRGQELPDPRLPGRQWRPDPGPHRLAATVGADTAGIGGRVTHGRHL